MTVPDTIATVARLRDVTRDTTAPDVDRLLLMATLLIGELNPSPPHLALSPAKLLICAVPSPRMMVAPGTMEPSILDLTCSLRASIRS